MVQHGVPTKKNQFMATFHYIDPVRRRPILNRSLKKGPNGNPGIQVFGGCSRDAQPRDISFYSLFLQLLEESKQ